MTIAAIGAVILGEVGEAAMLAFLFSISEGLEEYALARTRRGLRALLSLAPEEATVLRDGTETTITATELQVGDTMLVRPGGSGHRRHHHGGPHRAEHLGYHRRIGAGRSRARR